MENNELIKWLNNIKNNVINEGVLYIKNLHFKTKFNIFDLSNFKNINDFANKNLISTNYINKYIFETFLEFNPKILYVRCDEKTLSKFEIFFENIKINVEEEFKDIEFFLIERLEFKEVLNKENLYDFLNTRRNILMDIFEEENKMILIEEKLKVEPNIVVSNKKRFYYSNMGFENFTLLQFDINILKNANLLTSRLANYIYKICILYIYRNEKFIGNKVHNNLEVRSQTWSFNDIKDRGLKSFNKGNISMDFFIKPVRCYDLTINENVLETKINILRNLINLNIRTLDIDKIIKVVELSNNEIKEIRDPILKPYLRTYVKALKNSNTIN